MAFRLCSSSIGAFSRLRICSFLGLDAVLVGGAGLGAVGGAVGGVAGSSSSRASTSRPLGEGASGERAKARSGLLCSGEMETASDGAGDGALALRALLRVGRVEAARARGARGGARARVLAPGAVHWATRVRQATIDFKKLSIYSDVHVLAVYAFSRLGICSFLGLDAVLTGGAGLGAVGGAVLGGVAGSSSSRASTSRPFGRGRVGRDAKASLASSAPKWLASISDCAHARDLTRHGPRPDPGPGHRVQASPAS